MAYKYRTDYQILEWHDLGSLAILLNTMVNDGWRVENHKLSAGDDKSGWTIFAKHIQLDLPLLERDIKVSEVYHIVNAHLQPGEIALLRIDVDIKKAVRLPGDDHGQS
jgi:hypothetical protein